MLTPTGRRIALTAHVVASVGWLGSVAAFLALAVAGLASRDVATVRGAYLGMDLTGRLVIVPLCLASLVTGLVQSLGTAWGLFRHYWVLAKLVINVVSTAVLLLHLRAIEYVAGVAARVELASGDHRRLRVQLAVDASLALLALLVATGLSIFKPRGVTSYGWRKQREERAAT